MLTPAIGRVLRQAAAARTWRHTRPRPPTRRGADSKCPTRRMHEHRIPEKRRSDLIFRVSMYPSISGISTSSTPPGGRPIPVCPHLRRGSRFVPTRPRLHARLGGDVIHVHGVQCRCDLLAGDRRVVGKQYRAIGYAEPADRPIREIYDAPSVVSASTRSTSIIMTKRPSASSVTEVIKPSALRDSIAAVPSSPTSRAAGSYPPLPPGSLGCVVVFGDDHQRPAGARAQADVLTR